MIYFFQLVSMKIYIDLFDITPLLILCFEQKGGEECFFYLDPFVDNWQKGGEVFEFLYACFICMFCFYLLVCRLIGIKRIFFSLMFFGIKSMFHVWYHLHVCVFGISFYAWCISCLVSFTCLCIWYLVLCMSMHTCLWAYIAYLLCFFLCMS